MGVKVLFGGKCPGGNILGGKCPGEMSGGNVLDPYRIDDDINFIGIATDTIMLLAHNKQLLLVYA